VRYSATRSGIYWYVVDATNGRVFAWTGTEANARLMCELLNKAAA
jgi:hypothetical protein